MTLLLLLVGVLTLLGQAALLRELNVAFYGSELVYLLAIGVWLFWTALGATLGRRRWQPRARHAALALLLFAPTLLAAAVFVRGIRPLFAVVPGAYLSFSGQVAALGLALLPLGVLSGLLFQWAAKLSIARGTTLARAYALESAGAVLGGLVATISLVLGLANFTLIVLGALLAATGSLFPVLSGGGRRLRLAGGAFLLLLVPLLLGSAPLDRALTRWSHPSLEDSVDTPYGRLTVTEQSGQRVIFENDALACETEGTWAEAFVHPAALLHPDPRRVLILGGAAEGLVGEVLAHRPVAVDYVELNAAYLDRILPRLPASRRDPLNDPSLGIVVADPRRFLETAESYDLILLGMPAPDSGQANRYYTREFFALCARRLREGGLLALRLPAAENFWTAPLLGRTASIARALETEFEDVWILPGGSSLLLASRAPLSRDAAVVLRRYHERGLETKLTGPAYLSYLLTNDRVADFERQLAATPAPPNRDAWPICYAYTQVLWLSRFFPALATMDLGALSARLSRAGPWLLLPGIALPLLFLLARRRTLLRRILLVATAGFIGMVLENLLILNYQMRSGVLFQDIGLLLTLFMAGLALGSLLLDLQARRAGAKGLPAWSGFVLGAAFALQAAGLAWRFAAGGALGRIATGGHLMLAGFLLAGLFAYASLRRVADQRAMVSPLYAADLLGGACGAVVGSVVLTPALGFAATAKGAAWLALAALCLI